LRSGTRLVGLENEVALGGEEEALLGLVDLDEGLATRENAHLHSHELVIDRRPSGSPHAGLACRLYFF
jgi:hypothetical protein